MTGGPVRVKKPAPSAECRLFVPGMQASGGPTDLSANAWDGTRGAALSEATLWSQPGYMLTGEQSAGSNGGFGFPAGSFDWDQAEGDSFFVSFELRKGLTPGSEKAFFGNLAGPTSTKGLQLRMSTGGNVKAQISDGTVTKITSGTANVCTNTDQVIQAFYDSDLRELSCYALSAIDRALDAYLVTGSTLGTNPLSVGHGGNVSTNGSLAVRIRNIQVYVFKGQPLPVQWRRGAAQLRTFPNVPIGDWSTL